MSNDDNKTAGRCHPCNVVFVWYAGTTRRVYMARCPRCGGGLHQTSVRMVARAAEAFERRVECLPELQARRLRAARRRRCPVIARDEAPTFDRRDDP